MLKAAEFDEATAAAIAQISASFPEKSLVQGIALKTFDRDRMTGLGIMADPNKPVNAEMIRGDSFQFLAATVVDMDHNRHIDAKNADAYFQGKRAQLDAAVPQYGQRAPPSLQHRDRATSDDRVVTDVELGQYGGRVGVYKQVNCQNVARCVLFKFLQKRAPRSGARF
jgi:hypothetical protein